MHYILRLSLPEFYVRALQRQGVRDEILLVVKDRKILDATASALNRGIWLGMGKPQARSILTDIPASAFREWQSDAFETEAERWLEVCANYSSCIEPDEPHSAFLDLNGHPDPARTALHCVRAIEERMGLSPVWAIAGSKWQAAVEAETARRLSSLPTSYLTPVHPGDRLRLAFLGYRTVDDVAKIPLQELTEQFGESGVRIHQAARGGCVDLVRPLYPPQCISEQMFFPGALHSLELVDAALQALTERLSARLQHEDRQGKVLKISVEREDLPAIGFLRRFTKPMNSSAEIVAAARRMLADQLHEPICALRILMPELVKAKRTQVSLIGGKPKDRLQSAEIALDHVKQVFGSESILRASEIFTPRRVRVLRVWKKANGWV